MQAVNAFLGVSQSATGRAWQGLSAEVERQAAALAQTNDCSEALARILARQGVKSDGVAAYLNPSLRELMPDPSSLRDMDKATARLCKAVKNKDKIAIFADYDVDGAAAAALLIDWLRQVDCHATLYVPDRLKEGYGPNGPAMARLAEDHNLIICVDCGTVAFDAIAAAEPADVLVLDHHLGAETLPQALAVVNPNRQDESGDLSYVCAAGVVFLLLVAANRALRKVAADQPDLIGMLDLVALATVADVAPLVGLNRAFVRQGLKIMAQRQRPGLAALCDVANLNTPPAAYHLGFMLGPRINAGGRIGQSDLGARLLSCSDGDESAALAARLDELNSARKDIEQNVRLQAVAQAEARATAGPLVWAAGDGWHPGVVGIVAARLKEATNRPAVVIGFDGKRGQGSGRSVVGIDLGAAVSRLMREGLITSGGGHRMAAGLSLQRAQLKPAMARLDALLLQQGAHTAAPPQLHVDGILSTAAATCALIEDLDKAGPFGAAAPPPRLAIAATGIAFAKRVGDNHLRVTLQDASGARLDSIAFGAFDTPLGPLLENHGGRLFHVAGHLEIDTWGGRRKPKLRIEDAVLAG